MTVSGADRCLVEVAAFVLPPAWLRIGWSFRQRSLPEPSRLVRLPVQGVR